MRNLIKRFILMAVMLIMAICMSGCQKKEPTLAEQYAESVKQLEEAKEREREAKQKEKELQEAYDILKRYQNIP